MKFFWVPAIALNVLNVYKIVKHQLPAMVLVVHQTSVHLACVLHMFLLLVLLRCCLALILMAQTIAPSVKVALPLIVDLGVAVE